MKSKYFYYLFFILIIFFFLKQSNKENFSLRETYNSSKRKLTTFFTPVRERMFRYTSFHNYIHR